MTRLKDFDIFVAFAKAAGLPTLFLPEVRQWYSFDADTQRADASGSTTRPPLCLLRGSIGLSSHTWDKLGSPTLDLNDTSEIATFYHEATHAHFNIKRCNNDVIRSWTEEWITYYRDSPLDDGTIFHRSEGTADDPERLYTEAGAEYVEHRVHVYCSALHSLRYSREHPDYPLRLDYLKDTYNRDMRKRLFGYQYGQATFFPDRSRVLYPTRQLPLTLKRYCDSAILEDKIPDDFDRVSMLGWLAMQLRSRSGPVDSPRSRKV